MEYLSYFLCQHVNNLSWVACLLLLPIFKCYLPAGTTMAQIPDWSHPNVILPKECAHTMYKDSDDTVLKRGTTQRCLACSAEDYTVTDEA